MNPFLIRADGHSEPLPRIRCADECAELQDVLEKNPDLLAGDRIDPEDPRRWLLVKREMPVPDPSSRSARWSIDFLYLDQDAIPTFVECKRFADTRSRREVVGQVLEYAANATKLWSRENLETLARATAKSKNVDFDASLAALRLSEGFGCGAFFTRCHENLREGQIRLIFCLEESPRELRSIVDFLNRQMERTEVLLVELRHFSAADVKIIVPALFGFSEEAHEMKQTARVTRGNSKRKWTEESFFEAIATSLPSDQVQSIRRLHDSALAGGLEVSRGNSGPDGGFSLRAPVIAHKSAVSITSRGRLWLNFGYLRETDRGRAAADRLRSEATSRLGLDVPAFESRSSTGFPVEDWIAKSDELGRVLLDLARQFRGDDKGAES